MRDLEEQRNVKREIGRLRQYGEGEMKRWRRRERKGGKE